MSITERPWTPAEIAQLHQFWAIENWTANKIARELHRSRNSIISAARRYDCGARPSPIRPRLVAGKELSR